MSEPEHYSWNLGTPDNAVGTEVIVNPYASRPVNPQRPKQIQSKPINVDLRDTNGADLAKEYNGNINPYKHSFSAEIDGKELLLPTQDPAGRDLSEDESINLYVRDGKHLGSFGNPQEAETYRRSKER
jgi:hypothetical protein